MEFSSLSLQLLKSLIANVERQPRRAMMPKINNRCCHDSDELAC